MKTVVITAANGVTYLRRSGGAKGGSKGSMTNNDASVPATANQIDICLTCPMRGNCKH